MQLSNKTGLVLKISLVLILLLSTVVYKLNDYFQNDKWFTTQNQLHSNVVLLKTTVSSQLAQLKNTLSAYENDFSEANINWVQLDPFYAIAKLEVSGNTLKVLQIQARSNTPAERWNAAYLEKALAVNKSKEDVPIIVQLFQNRSGEKFIALRYKASAGKELAIVTNANYFQKFFDINRGDNSTSLLATTEDLLAAHSEGDYIATSTHETKLSQKKYLFEKEEIVGTNLIAINYVLKKKIITGFAVPWSIVGVVAGVGCLLLAVLFYALDPMEKKVERYKKQERDQIYKDTLGGFVAQAPILNADVNSPNGTPSLKNQIDVLKAKIESQSAETPIAPIAVDIKKEKEAQKMNLPSDFYSIKSDEEKVKAVPIVVQEQVPAEHSENPPPVDQFLAFNGENMDMADIEKALALDDFENDEPTMRTSSDLLEKNLTPQKISVSAAGSLIEKPNFFVEKKQYKVDEVKVNIRRPEKL